MEEFEPKLKRKIFNRQFFSKYVYVLVVGLILLLGVSYSITFFVQNKSVATGTLTTGSLTVTYTDRNINATGLSKPSDDGEGLPQFVKALTLENTSSIDGVVKLTLTRTSGLALTDMRYAVVVNGSIQEIGDVPGNGEILETAILADETISVELRLWPKTTYTGAETTFVGELTPTLSYLGIRASSLSNPAGKYVNFNCDVSTCEVWQIVKVEDGRLVLTRQGDYEGATSRTNSGKYRPDTFNPVLTFNDDSLITSLSTDGKNVYLAKTVKITGGSGTSTDPYELENNIFNEEDKKLSCIITYKEKIVNTFTANSNGISYSEVGTQRVYYNGTNYISQVLNELYFTGWEEGENTYSLGDTITFTTDKILIAKREPAAAVIGFDDTNIDTSKIPGFNCDNVQCAIIAIYNAKH